MLNKWLFLEYRQFEQVEGFARRLQPPTKHPEPCLVSEAPWENDALGLYGSVVQRDDGLFQMWYMCGGWGQGKMKVAYAESDDGIRWRRPELDLCDWQGRPTNVLTTDRPIGAAVLYDLQDPRPGWRYKFVCAPASFHNRICGFRSPDGIHWKPAAENPIIGTDPDGPMCLMRLPNGRYALHHRPCWGDRRVARSESWDFAHWTEPRVVCEPEPGDGTNVQFYGMGAIPYGEYEIGTLWVYHTDPEDMVWSKGLGVLEPELIYGRGGYAWHRAALGQPWIALEDDPEAFEQGQIHTASQPLLLNDEIRFYYAACRNRHGKDGTHTGSGPTWAIRFAACKPDRFVSVTCTERGEILTRPFWTEHPEFFINGNIRDGLRAEVLDVKGNVITGFGLEDAEPLSGDGLRLRLRWQGAPDRSVLAEREIRLRLQARDATLYSIAAGTEEQARRYWEFRLPYFLPKDLELHERQRQ